MRVTGPLLKVLDVFLDAQGDEIYGLELIRATRIKSGTLYPLLERLLENGWLEARWEDAPGDPKGPRRRYYRLTGVGAAEGQRIQTEYRIGGAAWAF
jgi:PadR family transcriptional regulator, regulatory protein PadR